ncbi:MAG: hypothetical protein ABSB19_02220 [Methylomonas sp.]|jgi:hypothetical protein
MNIHPRPDQEFAILEAIRAGLIASEEDALDIGLENLRARLKAQVAKENDTLDIKRNNLVEIFNSVRCDDLDFSRNNTSGRPIDL